MNKFKKRQTNAVNIYCPIIKKKTEQIMFKKLKLLEME